MLSLYLKLEYRYRWILEAQSHEVSTLTSSLSEFISASPELDGIEGDITVNMSIQIYPVRRSSDWFESPGFEMFLE